MLRKLHTKGGKEPYERRETSAERVFCQIKWARNLRQLSFRGLAKAKASRLVECAVHNLTKMYKAGIAWAWGPSQAPPTQLGLRSRRLGAKHYAQRLVP